MKNDIEQYLNKEIVVDTNSSWIYIGVLDKVTQSCLILSDADAHDNKDTKTTKERYIYESKSTGTKPNRRCVHVNLSHVVSFSLLGDIKDF